MFTQTDKGVILNHERIESIILSDETEYAVKMFSGDSFLISHEDYEEILSALETTVNIKKSQWKMVG